MTNLISVVIPCFQQGHFLEDAIASLRAQTYPFWEAIVVNDGSTDDTESIALHFCASDNRIRYFSKPNGGLSSARNMGIAHATGRWIQFLDADDLLLPRKFEAHIAATSDSDGNVVTYSNYFHGAHNAPKTRVNAYRVSHKFLTHRPVLDVATRWEFDFSIPIHAGIFPSWLFSEAHLSFDESLPNHEDWDIWMQVLPLISKVLLLPDELAIYRVNLDSMSRDKLQMWKGFSLAIEKQKDIFRFDAEVIRGLNYLAETNDYNYYHGVRGNVKRYLDSRIFRRWPWSLFAVAMRSAIQPKPPKHAHLSNAAHESI